MSLTTYGGAWTAENYKEINKKEDAYEYRGCEIKLLFKPNDLVEAPKIGLTQTVKALRSGKTTPVRPEVTGRTVTKDEGDEGRYHDRAAGKTNPIYGTNNPTGPDKSLGSGTSLGNMQWGKREVDTKGKVTAQEDAWLTDGPQRAWNKDDELEQSFETTALSVEGTQKDTYYGSVEWGYKTNKEGAVSLLPLRVVSMGVPSGAFMKSAKKWNDAKVDVSGTATDTQDLPLSDHASMTEDQIVKLSNEDLEKRIKTLTDSYKELIKTEPNSPNAQNKKFELKFLETEAKARGTYWGSVKHYFGYLAN